MKTSQYPHTLEGKTCTEQNLIPFPFPQRSVGILNNITKFYMKIIGHKFIHGDNWDYYIVTIRYKFIHGDN